MQLRRQLETSWAPIGTFSYDGSTSDLALQLYTRSQAGDVIAQLSLDSIPDTVTSRLDTVNVAFNDLDGFAQRAVLWDSGFAVTSDNEVKQIKTINGLSMAEIALTLEEFETTSCTAFDCVQPDSTAAYNNNQCTGTDMLTGVKCVVEEFDMADQSLAMWSIGGDATAIPEIEVAKHMWTDSSADTNYKVYAIHTKGSSSERKYGDCPSVESYGYLNIPCYGADDVPSSYEVTEPTPTDWVTSWIGTFATDIVVTSSSAGSSGSSHSLSSSGSSHQLADDNGSSSGGEHTGTNVALLGGAVGGGLGLLLIAVLVGLFVANRRRKRKRSEEDNQRTPKAVEHVEMMSPRDEYEQRPTVFTHPRSTLDDSQPRSGVTLPSSEDVLSSIGTERGAIPPYQPHPTQPPLYDADLRHSRQEFAARPPRIKEHTRQSTPAPIVPKENVRPFGSDVAPPRYEDAVRSSRSSNQSATFPVNIDRIRDLGSDNTLQVLAADPTLDRRRIQLDQLQVERQLPMTTLQTDSYIARYKDQQVLVKRVTLGQNVNARAVEDLAIEIQQRAHLKHPNLVQFIGVGWTSALDLTMVVEFLSQGTLRAFLDRHKSSMTTWSPQKTSITAGIARALVYLHKQTPVFIYHDLCAKNVLLTDNLEPKLANCGSPETNASIGAKQRSRQAFWIAPEVLKGENFSPAADIFSFGILLAELDTCEAPYFDARAPNGRNLDQGAILALVTEGRLRPSFSAECPKFIRQLGVACCQQDPEKRLTAQQIVQLLEGN